MKEILKIFVDIDSFAEINGKMQKVISLSFSGRCESEYFNGTILPGAADTQVFKSSGNGTLSAKYVLEGVDYTGDKCRVFIENTAAAGDEYTTPKITTDSKALSWLETAELVGKIETVNRERVIIHILN